MGETDGGLKIENPYLKPPKRELTPEQAAKRAKSARKFEALSDEGKIEHLRRRKARHDAKRKAMGKPPATEPRPMEDARQVQDTLPAAQPPAAPPAMPTQADAQQATGTVGQQAPAPTDTRQPRASAQGDMRQVPVPGQDATPHAAQAWRDEQAFELYEDPDEPGETADGAADEMPDGHEGRRIPVTRIVLMSAASVVLVIAGLIVWRRFMAPEPIVGSWEYSEVHVERGEHADEKQAKTWEAYLPAQHGFEKDTFVITVSEDGTWRAGVSGYEDHGTWSGEDGDYELRSESGDDVSAMELATNTSDMRASVDDGMLSMPMDVGDSTGGAATSIRMGRTDRTVDDLAPANAETGSAAK